MHHFCFKDAREALAALVRLVPDHGDKVAPRGQVTYELRHVTMRIRDSRACLATGMGRKFNSKLAAAETLQLLGGFADPSWMSRVSPQYLKFTGGAMTGAYGPRLRDQLPKAIQTLKDDRDTRQAVVTIWIPERDLFVEHGDRPCTVYMSFMIRDGQLITSTYMRSQDVYLGLTYDLVMFGQLHLSVANVLGVPAGPLMHTVQSLHVYERDLQAVKQISWPDQDVKYPPLLLRGLGTIYETWEDVQNTARQLAYNADFDDDDLGPMNQTERWLRQNSEAARAGH